jgi:hypothetical protein
MSICPGGGRCSHTNALEGDGVKAQAAGGASTQAYGLQAAELRREHLAGDVVAATLMHGRRWIPRGSGWWRPWCSNPGERAAR